MNRGIVLVILKSGRQIIGSLVHMRPSLVTLEYPFYVSVEGKIAVPDDVQVKQLNVPVESITVFEPAPAQIASDYEFYAASIIAGNALKDIYPDVKMSTVDPKGTYKFFNCLNRQKMQLN